MAVVELTKEEVDESLSHGNKMMTATEVALLMRRKPETVRMWFKQGKMRAVKSGTMWYTIMEEVRRFITDGPYGG